jgi:PRC-barrel domain
MIVINSEIGKNRGDIAMRIRHIAYCLALTALIATPAMAQNKADATQGGVEFLTSQSPDQWRGSKLIGVDVIGPNDEKIGAISEVLLDHSGNGQAVVIGIGGFLGIGQKEVAVPFNTLKWVSHEEAAATAASKAAANPPPSAKPGAGASGVPAPAPKPVTDASVGYPDHAVVSMTKDELKNAPDFHYATASSQ